MRLVRDALRRDAQENAVRPADNEQLVLGAREAVGRIRRGELEVETYIARLLAHYNTHKELNVANAIDPARLMEEARLADRMHARGATLGSAFGLPFAVKGQIAVAGYPTTGGAARSVNTCRNAAPPQLIASSAPARSPSA